MRLREALEAMVRQFAFWCETGAGGYVTCGMSVLADAFEALGWDEPHPAPEDACGVEGCSRQATCGTPVEGGRYLRCCGVHYLQAIEDLQDLPDLSEGEP